MVEVARAEELQLRLVRMDINSERDLEIWGAMIADLAEWSTSDISGTIELDNENDEENQQQHEVGATIDAEQQ